MFEFHGCDIADSNEKGKELGRCASNKKFSYD
jgi:hypothetical protein